MALTRVKARVRTRVRAIAGHQETQDRLDRQLARIEETERELARVAPQLAALEARLEKLRERVERAVLPSPRVNGHEPAPGDDVRTLQEELARQQEQVRARISAAVRFEERLRRLEDALELHQG